MSALEPPDIHFLNASLGWLGLGIVREAKAELERISPGARLHPDVLEAQWQVCAAERDWTAALEVADELVRRAPQQPVGWINRSYTLHEMHLTQQALSQLQPVADRFPKISTIPYNLACYACRLGRLVEARMWLSRAIQIKGVDHVKHLALEDPDLAPLRKDIEKL